MFLLLLRPQVVFRGRAAGAPAAGARAHLHTCLHAHALPHVRGEYACARSTRARDTVDACVHEIPTDMRAPMLVV